MKAINLNYELFLYLGLVLCFTFGAILYFYGDLDNPVIPVYVPLVKDFFWILIGSFIITNSLKIGFGRDLFFIIIIYGYLALVVFSKMMIFSEGEYFQYLIVIKNFIVYLIFGVILFEVFLKKRSANDLLLITHNVLLFSIALSLILHFFYPVNSASGRLWGTFGSPNSAGFIICSSIFILYLLNSKGLASNSRIWLSIILFTPSLFLTASLNSIFSISLFMIFYQLTNLFLARKISLNRTLIFIFILITLIFALVFSLYQILELTEIYIRLGSIFTEGLLNDAIAIRLQDFYKVLYMECSNRENFLYLFGCNESDYVRMDSTLFTFIYNLGWINSILFLLTIYSSVLLFVFSRKENLNKSMVLFTVFFITVIPVNLFFQHSFEVFPSSLIYALFLVISIHELKDNFIKKET